MGTKQVVTRRSTERATQVNVERAEQRRAMIAEAYWAMQPKSMRRLASTLHVNVSTVQRAVQAGREADNSEQLQLFADAD